MQKKWKKRHIKFLFNLFFVLANFSYQTRKRYWLQYGFFESESTSLAMELTPTITCTRTSCTTQDYSLIVWNNHKVLL